MNKLFYTIVTATALAVAWPALAEGVDVSINAGHHDRNSVGYDGRSTHRHHVVVHRDRHWQRHHHHHEAVVIKHD